MNKLRILGSWPQLTSKFWRCSLSMNRPKGHQVLDCASPLALFDLVWARKSGRGLPQSKTLSRPTHLPPRFMVPLHAQKRKGPLHEPAITAQKKFGPSLPPHSSAIASVHGDNRTR